jgi:hypothetical protein
MSSMLCVCLHTGIIYIRISDAVNAFPPMLATETKIKERRV